MTLILNKPVKMLLAAEIDLLPAIESITHTAAFDESLKPILQKYEIIKKKNQLKKNVLNIFKSAIYSAFKQANSTTLSNKQVIKLFSEIMKVANINKFMSCNYDIIYSKTTNQFAFLHKAETRYAIATNNKTLMKLKIEPADLCYEIEDIVSCEIIPNVDGIEERYYGVNLKGYDKTYSIRSDLIEDEERKARIRKHVEKIPISKIKAYVNEAVLVESKTYNEYQNNKKRTLDSINSEESDSELENNDTTSKCLNKKTKIIEENFIGSDKSNQSNNEINNSISSSFISNALGLNNNARVILKRLSI